ncbi:hypothetical protein ACOME3_007166 [Neoechinorhynchus agilis]
MAPLQVILYLAIVALTSARSKSGKLATSCCFDPRECPMECPPECPCEPCPCPVDTCCLCPCPAPPFECAPERKYSKCCVIEIPSQTCPIPIPCGYVKPKPPRKIVVRRPCPVARPCPRPIPVLPCSIEYVPATPFPCPERPLMCAEQYGYQCPPNPCSEAEVESLKDKKLMFYDRLVADKLAAESSVSEL